MQSARLTRLITGPKGTFGALAVDNKLLVVTLEPNWRENKKNVSCIPTGNYLCSAYNSKNHGKTWRVENVYGRTGILFHCLNWAKQTGGCIGIGMYYGNNSILRSRDAMIIFRDTMDKTFLLTVVNAL